MWEEATNYCSHERGEGWDISPYKRPNGLYHYSSSTQLHERPATDTVNKDTNNAYFAASGLWLRSWFCWQHTWQTSQPPHPPNTPRAVSGRVFRTVLNSSTAGLFTSSTQSCVRTDLLFFFLGFFVLSEKQPAGFKESNGFEGENVGVRIKERRNAHVSSCWFLLPVDLNSAIGTTEKLFN